MLTKLVTCYLRKNHKKIMGKKISGLLIKTGDLSHTYICATYITRKFSFEQSDSDLVHFAEEHVAAKRG